MIKAIPCNGIQECKDGSDEKCDLPNITIWVIIGEHNLKYHIFINIFGLYFLFQAQFWLQLLGFGVTFTHWQ